MSTILATTLAGLESDVCGDARAAFVHKLQKMKEFVLGGVVSEEGLLATAGRLRLVGPTLSGTAECDADKNREISSRWIRT